MGNCRNSSHRNTLVMPLDSSRWERRRPFCVTLVSGFMREEEKQNALFHTVDHGISDIVFSFLFQNFDGSKLWISGTWKMNPLMQEVDPDPVDGSGLSSFQSDSDGAMFLKITP